MRIAVAVDDLFFLTRIQSTAQALGVAVEHVPLARAVERLAAAPPDKLILDLHASGDPFAVAAALKAAPQTRAIELVGFYSHVDNDTRARALAAGVDRVLPRSAFTAQLAAILGGA